MIFIDNKYTKCYFNIIAIAKARISITGYVEKHHILPRSLGGNNTTSNLVQLTAREHFICHALLTKMTSGDDRRKMIFASNMMLCGKNRYVPSGKIYQIVKEDFAKMSSILHTGKSISDKQKLLISEANKNKIVSDETCIKISNSKIGKKRKLFTESAKENMSKCKLGEKNANFGKTFTACTIEKMKLSAQNRSKLKCLCGKECSPSNFKRWHGDNCKLIKS